MSQSGSEYSKLPTREVGTFQPLTHFVIAQNLGITEYTEDNVEECLRRARVFLALGERLGKPVISRRDGSPLLVSEVDERFIRQHLGAKVVVRVRTAEEFDEHMRKIEKRLGGETGR